MLTWLIAGVVGWMICGVLAYGLIKGHWRNLAEHEATFTGTSNEDQITLYSVEKEFLCWLCGILGPFGLYAEFVICGSRRLCYLMPKELCAPRQLEEKENFSSTAENLRELWEKGPPPDVEKEFNDPRHPE